MEELSSECKQAVDQFKAGILSRREILRSLFVLGLPASTIFEMIGEAEAQTGNTMAVDPAELKAQFDRLAVIIASKEVSDALTDIMANEHDANKQVSIAQGLANTFKDPDYYSRSNIPLASLNELRFSMRVFEPPPAGQLDPKVIYAERWSATPGGQYERGICASYGNKLCVTAGVP
ncbi:hypothetical protein ACYG9R_06655 [Mesorhizobium sp. RSR565B]|uniref:hypothetical protein n=1 Tax=Mesorhizobium sp. L103C565B0 TaxID=1287094 RepID=UPI0004CE3B8B|nr:hypothetical protein [Mesorhizobium sp. L103C565B0]